MATREETFVIPPSLAIADGAATPDPGGTGARGVIVWSTTTNALMRWSGTAWNIAAPAGGGAISVSDEGGLLTSALASLNFVGTGITATNTGSAVTVTIPGGGGGGSGITLAKAYTLKTGNFIP